MIVERLRPEHIVSVNLQPAQARVAGVISFQYAEHLCTLPGVGWAVTDGDTALACGGIVEVWPNRAQSWALFSAEVLPRFRAVHRLVTNVLNDAPWRRIEMDVDAEHAAGFAWATRLGFQNEGLRRKYTADGRDVFLFARVK
jgi:RimJ/RimL family protein N-acetyltransferase